jgi:Protein of unknown function (DUF2905)
VDVLGRSLLVLGALTAAVGLVLIVAAKLGVPRLPGDIVVQRKNFTFYAPLGWMILLSVALTVILNLISRFRR